MTSSFSLWKSVIISFRGTKSEVLNRLNVFLLWPHFYHHWKEKQQFSQWDRVCPCQGISFTARVAHSPPSSSCLFTALTPDTGEKSEIQTVHCLTVLMMSLLQCLEGELPNRGLSAPPPNPKTHICKSTHTHTHTHTLKWGNGKVIC